MLVFFTADTGFFDQVTRRQQLSYGIFDPGKVFAALDCHVDAIQLAVAVERLLGGGDVDSKELGGSGIDDPFDGELSDGERQRAVQGEVEAF